MKKILSSILCLCLLFIFTGCGSEQDKEEVMNAYIDSMNSIDYAELESIDLSVTVFAETDGAQSMSIDATMDAQLIANDEKKLEGGAFLNNLITTSDEIDGNLDIDYDVYIKDDFLYINAMGFMKEKSPIDLSEFSLEVEDDGEEKELITIDDVDMDAIESASMEESDGEVTYTIELIADKLKSEDFEGVTVTENPVIEIAFKDNMITRVKMIAAGDDQASDTSCDIELEVEIKSYNKLDSIDFPDFSDYVLSETPTI